MKNFKKVLLVFLAAALFSLGGFAGYTFYNLNKLTSPISKTNEDLGIEDGTLDEINALMSKYKFNKDEIVNIALFGIDSRDTSGQTRSRSDSIIVISVDKKHNKIKLSSIMRDTYVEIEGRGKDKITHAYAFGGPQLAIKTINQNFGLNIKDFITVDFFVLEEIIDAIGGVEVEVKSYEIDELNKFIREVADIEGKSPSLITKSGTQTLDGMQAVSFGRIRKVGNGDFERTDRQRIIIISMIDKLKKLGLTDCIKLANKFSSSVQTSLTVSELAKLGTDILQNMTGFEIEQQRFPKDGSGQKINGIWYMTTDLDKTKKSIQSFIFEPTSSDESSKN